LNVDVTIRESESHSPQPTTGHARKEPVKLNSRQQTIVELFQTEYNYVGILHTILKVRIHIRTNLLLLILLLQ